MKKLLGLALIALLAVVACSKSDNLTPDKTTAKVDSVAYMHLIKTKWHGPDDLPVAALFSYKGSKVTKRNGFYYDLYRKAHFLTAYYDTVIYINANKIVIESKFNPNYPDIPYYGPHKREITLFNGLMVKKVVHAGSQSDSTYYFYDKNNRIQRTEVHYYGVTTKNFEFDVSGNLRKVTSVTRTPKFDGERLIDSAIFRFENYDNKPNLLKQFFIWDDLYYSSLSTNNFQSYEYDQYTPSTNIVYKSETRNFIMKYDANGNPKYY